MNDSDVILRWPVVAIQAQSFFKKFQRTTKLPHRKQRVPHVVRSRPIAGILNERSLVVRKCSAPVFLSLFNYTQVVKRFGEMGLDLERSNECGVRLIGICAKVSAA